MGHWSIRSRRSRLLLIVGVAAGTAVYLAARFADRREGEALARGHAYLEQGRFRQAIRAVSAIRPGSASEAEALTIRGLAEASLEEVSPARRHLERAWRLQPNAAAARVLAAIYLSACETDRGLEMLASASRIDPKDYRPWYAMGEMVHLRLRRYEQAIDAFREALRRRPDHLESRIGLADALVQFHRPQEAEPIVKGILRERPDDPRVTTRAAEIALELGRDQEAAQFLDRSLAVDADHREALILRARLLVRQGRPGEALAAAERACSLEPNDPSALGLLGSIQATLGRKEEAARTLERRHQVERRTQQVDDLVRTIQEKPDDPEARCRLGRRAAEAGMRTLAIQSYQAALALAPNYPPARQGLVALGFSGPGVSPNRGAAIAGTGR